MNTQELIKSFIAKLNSMKAISVADIPNIDLYMDQVTTFMDTYLSDMRRYETDKVLTKTMINNYAKNHLLPPPINKKYSQDHIILLIYIYYLKNLLSINDIQTMLTPLTEICHDTDNDLDMASIYTFIFSNYREESYRLMKDLAHKLDVAQHSFPELEKNQRESLQKFTYLCLLGYDVFIKKQLMEMIIDDIASEEASVKNADKKGKHRHEV